jgi:hypothetical protein
MSEKTLQTMLYGAVRQLVIDKQYYYDGYAGHVTEQGKAAFEELIAMMAPKICEAIKIADEQRGKDTVLKGLKGEFDSK